MFYAAVYFSMNAIMHQQAYVCLVSFFTLKHSECIVLYLKFWIKRTIFSGYLRLWWHKSLIIDFLFLSIPNNYILILCKTEKSIDIDIDNQTTFSISIKRKLEISIHSIVPHQDMLHLVYCFSVTQTIFQTSNNIQQQVQNNRLWSKTTLWLVNNYIR